MSQAYWAGYNDAMANEPKVRKDVDYKLGYADGLADRKNSNPHKAQNRAIAEQQASEKVLDS